MPQSGVRRRRRKRERVPLFSPNVVRLWISLALAVVAGTWLIAHLRFVGGPHLLEFRTASRAVDKAQTASALALRRIYPFSVVPGGTYSAKELEIARSVDPIVAAHY